MRTFFLSAILLLGAASCSGESNEAVDHGASAREVAFTGPAARPALRSGSRDADAPSPPPAPASVVEPQSGKSLQGGGAAQWPSVAASQSMVIRTGNASVEVRDLGQAITSLRQLADRLGGQVANTSVHGGRHQVPSAMLELKLPAERFDEAVNGLQAIGRVESVNVQAQDVGEEFVDVTARVANARRLEERLIALLATRTGRLEDVLAVERELARVREEIERYSGRLRYLEARVAVSTLVVSVHEPHPVLGHTNSPIAEALRDAWRNFVGFVAWLIAASGVILPVATLIAGAVWAGRRIIRRRRRET